MMKAPLSPASVLRRCNVLTIADLFKQDSVKTAEAPPLKIAAQDPLLVQKLCLLVDLIGFRAGDDNNE